MRLKKTKNDEFAVTEDDVAKAVEAWWSVPPAIVAAEPREERETTLLKMIQDAAADPDIPEFDEQQAVDEFKQYLWAGTETTALTLAWAMYLTSVHPEAAERIIREKAKRSTATANRTRKTTQR
jgi:cytochrome P450